MKLPRRFLLIHTAFPGDIVLALPLAQTLRGSAPDAQVAFVAVPRAAELLAGHPAIDQVLPYDKRGSQRGMQGFLDLVRQVRKGRFDCAVIPHRSLRSAALAWLAGVPIRIGFSTSAGKVLLTHTVRYRQDLHEIERNCELLRPLAITPPAGLLPELFPNESDKRAVDMLLQTLSSRSPDILRNGLVGLAPGSMWATKRWPADRYAALAKALLRESVSVALIGGEEDRELCEGLVGALEAPGRLLNAAGRLSLLQSAELIRRCTVLVTNDSAPMHLAVAMRTPVVALFGATVPAFGFSPRGAADQVVEISGLPCRPCGIHGGMRCPIGTFDCMLGIGPEKVLDRVHRAIAAATGENHAGDRPN